MSAQPTIKAPEDAIAVLFVQAVEVQLMPYWDAVYLTLSVPVPVWGALRVELPKGEGAAWCAKYLDLQPEQIKVVDPSKS